MSMQQARLSRAGVPTVRASGAVILLHGRGATADGMIGLAKELDNGRLAFIAPQAPGSSWYPNSFLAPLAANEPHLSGALEIMDDMIERLVAEGISVGDIALLGFSQGGCLALEYAARNARKYGAVIGLSAGLIGPVGTPRDYSGSLDGTAVFLGCSDIDTHIPLERVRETTAVMEGLGARTTERIYPGMGHTINADEINIVRGILGAIGGAIGSSDNG